MLDVKFRVFKGEKFLCAADIGVSIFTQGKTWNSLVKNVHEATMCHYDLSSMEDVYLTIGGRNASTPPDQSRSL